MGEWSESYRQLSSLDCTQLAQKARSVQLFEFESFSTPSFVDTYNEIRSRLFMNSLINQDQDAHKIVDHGRGEHTERGQAKGSYGLVEARGQLVGTSDEIDDVNGVEAAGAVTYVERVRSSHTEIRDNRSIDGQLDARGL